MYKSCTKKEAQKKIYTQKVALEYSVARSKSYISLSTLLTTIPCYSWHVYTTKAFDASQIKLRPRRFQPLSRNRYSSQ